MPDETTVEILLKWKEEGQAQHAEVMAKLTAMAALQNANTAATSANTAAAAAATPVWVFWAIAITAASIVLAPFIILIGSAAVILTAFAVAGAATLVLLGGLAAGFVALGAAVVALGLVALGGITGTAPAIVKFRDEINAAVAALARQAYPILEDILKWADKGVEPIKRIASEMIYWFEQRIPNVLKIVGQILQDLIPTFTAFGQFLGATMDKVFSMTSIGPGGTIKPLSASFEDGVKLMIRAVEWLITNLTALGQWFMERLPVYGPIVLDIFSKIGGIVLWAFQQFGRFADWLVANWPAITAMVSSAIQNITDQWNKWGPILTPLVQTALPMLGDAFKLISANAGVLVPLLVLVLATALVLVPAFLLMVGALLQIVTWIQNVINWFSQMKMGVIRDVQEMIFWLNKIPGVHIDMYGPAISAGSNAGTSGAGQSGPGRNLRTISITNHINGAQDPAAVARAVSRALQAGFTV